MSENNTKDPNKTIYVIGAGASRDGGIPLTSEILRVGYELIEEYWRRFNEKLSELSEMKKKGHKTMLVSADTLNFLDYLHESQALNFNTVYSFLKSVLGWNGEPEYLPKIEELWGILEIASERNANFGYGGQTSLEIKNTLLQLMYYVLWGCRVYDKPAWHVDYTFGSNPYENFVKKLPKERTIISLNYDIQLDMAIRKAKLPIDYGSNFIPFHPKDIVLRNNKASKTVLLLKPHGSFNWLYCPTCNRIEDFGLFHMSQIPGEQIPYSKTDADLPCKYDQTLRKAVIVPPSLIKEYSNPHLENIWQRMAEELKNAKRIVFIGYSLSGADISVKYFLKQSLSVNYYEMYDRDAFSIIVVNTSKEAIKEYARWFGKDKIEVINDKFSKYVLENM